MHDATAETRRRYQRLRLWCGITGIGLILVSLWLAVGLGLPRYLDDVIGWMHPLLAGVVTGLLLGLWAIVLQTPVDLYAMHVETRFEQRKARPIGPHVRRAAECLGGTVTAGLVVGGAVWLSAEAGLPWLWVGLASVGLLTLAFVHVAYPLAPAKVVPLPAKQDAWLHETTVAVERAGYEGGFPNVKWFDHGERSLAGGWQGLGPTRVLYLATTLTELDPAVAAGLIGRELGHKALGHRVQSVIGTAVWTIAGVGLTYLLFPGYGVAGTLLCLAATMSTWCWLGLFVWPALGRRQILAADAYAAARMPPERARAMLDALAERNLPDEELPPAVATVFHPIPPMKARREAMDRLFASVPEGVPA